MAANRLLSAQALDLKTIRVVFAHDSTPQATSDFTPDDAARWTLTCGGPFPAVTPTVAAFESTHSGSGVSRIDLVLSMEVTPGAVYIVTSNGITGVATDGIANVVAALPFVLPTPAKRSINLIDYMPPVNLQEDTTGDLRNFIACLQEPLNLLLFNTDRWVDIFDANATPDSFLDLILAQLGDPFTFATALTSLQKRRLATALVQIYKLKGTAKGIQVAILLFMGVRSEFFEFNGLGDRLNAGGKLSRGTYASPVSATPAFHLGGGSARSLLVKIGTTIKSQTDAGQSSPQAGNPPTDVQTDQVLQILEIMKPAYLKLVLTGFGYVRGGCTVSKRLAITDGGATVTLRMALIPDADGYRFLESPDPGAQEFNSAVLVATSGGVLSAYTPGGVRYWNGAGRNTTHATIGLLSNEITNALVKPVLTVTPGTRKLALSWPAVTGATTYRVYRSTASMTSPLDADNSNAPIEVSGDLTAYDDRQESGVTRNYMVTPVAQDSEGFHSNNVSGTAL